MQTIDGKKKYTDCVYFEADKQSHNNNNDDDDSKSNDKPRRIAAKFVDLRAKNQKALITYAMAGFPSPEQSLSAIKGMISGGADIVEIGFPFSDPLADGPAIQEASTISLGHGTTFEGFLDMVKEIRYDNPTTPLVLMTYTNILYSIGYDKALHMIFDAGIDGLILPDMSLDESKLYVLTARKYNIDTIFLASPNTSRTRLKRLLELSSGFLYMVAVYGTTGIKKKSVGGKNTAIANYTLDALRIATSLSKKTDFLPIGVGFGVSKPADVKKYVEAGADAVIVGSAYIDVIKKALASDHLIESHVHTFTKRLKSATRH